MDEARREVIAAGVKGLPNLFELKYFRMKHLVIAALGCGACLAPVAVMAATSGTITATGNIGGDCSVEGANLTFVQQPSSDSLIATGVATWSSTSAYTTFSLTAPQIQTPATEQQGINYVGQVLVEFNTASVLFAGGAGFGPFLSANFQGPGASVTPGAPFNGPVQIRAEISENTLESVLPAGDYSLTATATCVIP